VRQESLTAEQRKGIKVAILVLLSVMALFLLVLVAGDPIMYFGTKPPSVAYGILIYTPVVALCAMAYKRLG